MVKKIFEYLHREFSGVNQAALLLGGFAFASQLLGLVRDRMLAYVVGPGLSLDVYYAAFRIPDFLYLSIASLASITVLMPYLMEKLNSDDDGLSARRFMNNIFSAYMVFMVSISIILAICMPYIARIIAPGFDESQLHMLTVTSRIMLLSPIFIGLSNLIGTITQLYKNFFIFSLSPLCYNAGILIGIIYLYPHIGVYGLATGVIIGAMLHLFIQLPVVASRGFIPSFSKIHWKEVYNVVKISLPRTITLSCNSAAFVVLIAMASRLQHGSISLFTFSYNLQSVPVGIIGISYSVAAFPLLVQCFSKKDIDNFIYHITSAARQIIFWSLPATALLVVLRAQIVRVVLGAGSFSWADTRLTAAAAALFIVSLVSQGLVLLFVRGYYAAGKTRKPLLINVFSSVTVIVLAYALMHMFKIFPSTLSYLEMLLRVHDVPGTLMLALPIAYTLGSLSNIILIWSAFKKDFPTLSTSEIRKTFNHACISAFVMGVMAYYALGIFDNVFSLTTGFGVFMQGLLSGLIGIAAGIATLKLLGNKEIADLELALSLTFWKRGIVAPEQKEL